MGTACSQGVVANHSLLSSDQPSKRLIVHLLKHPELPLAGSTVNFCLAEQRTDDAYQGEHAHTHTFLKVISAINAHNAILSLVVAVVHYLPAV